MKIKKCVKCSKYGLSDKCSCAGKLLNPQPPKYSPEDKYAKYRRQYKQENN